MTSGEHPTRAVIRLDHLAHNIALLREIAGGRPLWPAIKANAYGHGAGIVARALLAQGCDTLCVAHPAEAAALQTDGVAARFLILSAALPDQAGALVAADVEPVVATAEMLQALSAAATVAGREIGVHLKVDTGMARIGASPAAAPELIARCQALPGLRLAGLMSHFASADAADKAHAKGQIAIFRALLDGPAAGLDAMRHMANSAALLDLPDSHLDALRPGIAIYGLKPSAGIANPRAAELRPVLEWRTRISFLKEVPAGTGISYGHAFHTAAPSLIATVPVGYGDGLSRRLSNATEMLVGGERCPQVGRITMDQCMLDVSALRGRVAVGDEVVLIGSQADAAITADEIAGRLGTINYEVVTAIAARVPRVVQGG